MPVAIGFHPYFRLADSPRDEWTISVGARTHWLLASNKVPTGVTQPIEQLFPIPQAVVLRDYDLDDVFSDLIRDSSGRAVMSVTGKTQRLDVVFGRRWRSAVVWAPKPTAPGPGPKLHLLRADGGHHQRDEYGPERLYQELQSIAPGGTWQESFWIRPSGF